MKCAQHATRKPFPIDDVIMSSRQFMQSIIPSHLINESHLDCLNVSAHTIHQAVYHTFITDSLDGKQKGFVASGSKFSLHKHKYQVASLNINYPLISNISKIVADLNASLGYCSASKIDRINSMFPLVSRIYIYMFWDNCENTQFIHTHFHTQYHGVMISHSPHW